MMADEKPKFLIKNGKRLDGRKPEEMRPLKMETGVIPNADGSAIVECGKTRILATVYGPRELHPRHLTIANRARVRASYQMMSFSVEDRKRPGPGRREIEISKVLTEALTKVVMTELYPTTAIDVFITVLSITTFLLSLKTYLKGRESDKTLTGIVRELSLAPELEDVSLDHHFSYQSIDEGANSTDLPKDYPKSG